MQPPSDLEPPDGLTQALVEHGVRDILENESFDSLRSTLHGLFEDVFPAGMLEAIEPMSTHLSLAIWNATPLPSRGWETAPRKQPGRNDPCLCGSGKKTKTCCGTLRRAELPPMTSEDLWPVVLQLLPAERLEEVLPIASRRLPPPAVGELARRLLDEGEPERALDLVEPVFTREKKRLGRLDDRWETALEALFDAYDRLGLEEEKEATMVRLADGLRPPLRASVWMRWAVIEADRGDWEKVWEHVARAAKDAPDHPSVALLETTLLGSEGRYDRARERASFWIRRLERQDLEDDDVLDFLRAVRDDPEGALLVSGPQICDRDTMERFWEVVGEAGSRPAPRYTLSFTKKSRLRARLRRPRGLKGFEDEWGEAREAIEPGPFGLPDPTEIWDPELVEWRLDLLEERPEGLDSLVVLRDLVEDAMLLPAAGSPWWRRRVGPLLERAFATVEDACRRARERAGKLPFLVESELDDAALALLYFWIRHLAAAGDDPEPVARLMLELDPDDRAGAADFLVECRLRAGDYQGALALLDEAPVEEPDPALVAALAHFALGDRQAARQALEEIDELTLVPRIVDHLAGIEPAGPYDELFEAEDEAARERADDMRNLWEAVDGSLAWLRETITELRDG